MADSVVVAVAVAAADADAETDSVRNLDADGRFQVQI